MVTGDRCPVPLLQNRCALGEVSPSPSQDMLGRHRLDATTYTNPLAQIKVTSGAVAKGVAAIYFQHFRRQIWLPNCTKALRVTFLAFR